MTTWDKIYRDYQKGGEAWATLVEDIDPLFKRFLSESHFGLKHALDIGCGTGKYLKLLQSLGFKTDGIDSSETAVDMTKQLLRDDSEIRCISMFEFDLPPNMYDLIISLSTIHHGTKEQVQTLINKIHKALIDGGKFFITVPDFESTEKWDTFKDNKELAKGTYSPLSGPEKGLPHSFYKKKEVKQLFSKFDNINMDLDKIGKWFVRASKQK